VKQEEHMKTKDQIISYLELMTAMVKRERHQ
jgi:hypothetical protein